MKLIRGIILLFKASFAKRMLSDGHWTVNQARRFMGNKEEPNA
jgi:hypothetical protein